MKQILSLFRRDWPLFLIIALLFGAGIVLGDNLYHTNPQLTKAIEKEIMKKFSWVGGLPTLAWIPAIWFNNVLSSVMAFVLGIIIFLPALIILENGLIVGIFQNSVAARGLSTGQFYLALLPHGVFELSAFFIAAGLGMRFGLVCYRWVWQSLTNRENKDLFRQFFKETAHYAILIVVFLTVAAIIEVTVSPLLIHKG